MTHIVAVQGLSNIINLLLRVILGGHQNGLEPPPSTD